MLRMLRSPPPRSCQSTITDNGIKVWVCMLSVLTKIKNHINDFYTLISTLYLKENNNNERYGKAFTDSRLSSF